MSACVNKPVNIITGVTSSPLVSNGLIAGAPTNIAIQLSSPAQRNPALALNPAYIGHQIPAGGRLEIELGGTFIRNGTGTSSQPFVDVNSNATVVLGTGLEKNYIVANKGLGVQHGNYSIVDNGANIIKITPLAGTKANGLENPRANQIGIKTIYLQPNATGNLAPYNNGPVDTQGTVTVRIFNALKNVIKEGSFTVKFSNAATSSPHIRLNNDGHITLRQTDITTISTELVESLDFQTVEPSSALLTKVASSPLSTNAPYALQFLIIDAANKQPDPFAPMKGIEGIGYKVITTDRSRARLYRDTNFDGIVDNLDTQIGTIAITGPAASKIIEFNNPTLTLSDDGVTGANGSVLRVGAEIGFKVGTYKVRVNLTNGGEATSHIIAR